MRDCRELEGRDAKCNRRRGAESGGGWSSNKEENGMEKCATPAAGGLLPPGLWPGCFLAWVRSASLKSERPDRIRLNRFCVAA